MHVCYAALLRVHRDAPLYAARHNVCLASPHRAVHYTAPHALCCTALLCAPCALCRTALCCPPPLCLVHVSIGGRVRWVWWLRSQPPPRHLSRDDEGAAPAASRPLRAYRGRYRLRITGAVTS